MPFSTRRFSLVITLLLTIFSLDAAADNFRGTRGPGFRQRTWGSPSYQNGYRYGNRNVRNWARIHNRRSSRAAYNAGFRDGLRAARNRRPGLGNAWGHPRFGNSGVYVPRGYFGQNVYSGGYYGPFGTRPRYGHPLYSKGTASQFGYRDGFNDGWRDLRAGRNFRADRMRNFKNGTRGYSSTLGSKDLYRDVYRDAYNSGYRAAFYNR